MMLVWGDGIVLMLWQRSDILSSVWSWMGDLFYAGTEGEITFGYQILLTQKHKQLFWIVMLHTNWFLK